ncbi:hypothetical protein F5B17DRAFT_450793 [Nemania serpens]|nr:hypothetical protein F5B17DRAFT_450793 [Nemania serpens]
MSSPDLSDDLNVEPHSDSLSRLQQISRDPVLRKSVRSVRVQLTSYHSALAENIGLFAYFQPRSIVHDVEPIDRILADWERHKDAPGSEARMNAIRVGHTLYKKRFQDQKQVLETRQFVQAVISALAKFPCAVKLKFEDWITDVSEAYGDAVSWDQFARNSSKLRKFSVRPLSSVALYKFGLKPEISLDLAVEILAGMATIKSTIKRVSISTVVSNTPLSVADLDILKNLSVAAKQLDTVSVKLGDSRVHQKVGGEAELYQFMSAILDTESLSEISIRLPRNLEDSNLSIRPSLTCRK